MESLSRNDSWRGRKIYVRPCIEGLGSYGYGETRLS